MARELVLITGVSGFIGFRILLEALATGYHVRAVVRKAAQVDIIRGHNTVLPYIKNLEIAIVPDILTVGAFDEVLKDVVFVIHAASPLASMSEDPQADIIDPAVSGTTTLLSSAAKLPNIKRVVITSSVVAVLPFGQETPRPVTEDDIVPRPSPPWGNFLQAYVNSKVLAYYASEDWMTANKPGFDLINIMPAFVFGANRLVANVKDLNNGTNSYILGILLGQKSPFPLPGNCVHVDDVALAHIRALDPAVSGNQSFLLASSTQGIVFDDAIEIAKRNFPVIVEKGLMPLDGTFGTTKCLVDASKAVKQLGMKLKSYEDQVKSLVGYYLELSGEEGVPKI